MKATLPGGALGIGVSDFCTCGETLDLKGSMIRGNPTVLHAASSDNGPSGGVVEIDGQATVTDTEISDNTTSFDNDGCAWAFRSSRSTTTPARSSWRTAQSATTP